METVSQFKNLRRLRLDNNPISDAGVAKLKGLENLQSINLHNTGITKNCINDLSNMKNLKRVYVWGTSIRQEDMAAVTGSLKIIANP
jgi:Leucine-rich repeat (LRR) protein